MGVEVKPMLFKKKIAPSCSYCARAGKIDDKTYLCKKRGMVSLRPELPPVQI